MLTAIGSCRLTKMNELGVNTTMLQINLTHSTKDILQLLKWSMKKIVIPDDITSFIFHSGMWSQKPVLLTDSIVNLISNTQTFIFEICSYKSHIFEDIPTMSEYYCHTDIFCAEKLFPHIPKEISIQTIKDTKEDLRNDIEEILSLIGNRKMIIVTHILSSFDVNSDRKGLIDDLTEICNEKNIIFRQSPNIDPARIIPIIIPGEILTQENKEKIIPDYNHYTEEGLEILKDFYQKKLKELSLTLT